MPRTEEDAFDNAIERDVFTHSAKRAMPGNSLVVRPFADDYEYLYSKDGNDYFEHVWNKHVVEIAYERI